MSLCQYIQNTTHAWLALEKSAWYWANKIVCEWVAINVAKNKLLVSTNFPRAILEYESYELWWDVDAWPAEVGVYNNWHFTALCLIQD